MKYKILPANDKGRDFILGDLHGCYSLLKQLLTDIGFHKDTDRLFLVGDLIDRGPESEKCLQLLLEPWVHAVQGNHEQMFHQMVNNDFKFLNLNDYWEEDNGGAWTKPWFAKKAPELKFWDTIISDLPYVIHVEGNKNVSPFWVVHAEIWQNHKKTTDDNISQLVLNSDDEQIRIFQWSRFISKHRTICKDVSLSGPIYCGHTPTTTPGVDICGHINLDGGAGWRNNHVFSHDMKLVPMISKLCAYQHNSKELFTILVK